MKKLINNILCKLGIHYPVSQRAYYMGEGFFPTETAGEASLCLWCGKIKKRGVVSIPGHYIPWQKDIRKGIHRFGRI